MDDDDLPRRRDDVLAALVKQPLDPLSVDELGERIEILEAEIERVKAHRSAATARRRRPKPCSKKGEDNRRRSLQSTGGYNIYATSA